MIKNIAILGSSGAIGSAFTFHLSFRYPEANIHAFSRNINKTLPTNINYHLIDYSNEESIKSSALIASKTGPLDMVIVATGILHEGLLTPEKSLQNLSAEKFKRLFEVNTIVPALIAKHFLPILNKKNQSIFAALSARVGSISDNRLGGWYAYRASKSALNMVIKTCSIEMVRLNKKAIVVGLHPGTVDSSLSKPFQTNVPPNKLFSPTYSAENLLQVLLSLTPAQSGKCFDWNGVEIEP